jgi:hypothetical protein
LVFSSHSPFFTLFFLRGRSGARPSALKAVSGRTVPGIYYSSDFFHGAPGDGLDQFFKNGVFGLDDGLEKGDAIEAKLDLVRSIVKLRPLAVING